MKPEINLEFVKSKGLLLPKKERYSLRDVSNVQVNSLFQGLGFTLSREEAAQIVNLSALEWGTTCSSSVKNLIPKSE